MAINDAISLNQLKQSVFNMKNYINNNMDSNNIYKGYQELIDYSFNINKNCIPEEGFFDFTFNTSDNYNVFYKVIELDKEYDFSDERNYVKREITSKNYDLTNGKGNNVYETNCPYSLMYIITGYNNENNITIMISIYYGKKYYLDESTGKSAYENNNKYVSIMYQANLSKFDTSVDHDYSDTLEIKFSLNEFNTNTLLQFPLYKANKSSIVPVDINDSVTIGEYSISLSNNSDIPPRSYIAGDNTIPYPYNSLYLSVFGNNNNIKMTSYGFVTGYKNEVIPYTSGAGLRGVLLVGNTNKINEVRENNYSGLGIIGEGIKVAGNGLYVGAYGTVPYSEMFALCQGTSSEDKVLFSVNRTTGAVSSISTPTEDNHLTTKKYVDDAIQNVSSGGIVNQLTDEELINALEKNEFLIPINVDINFVRGSAYYVINVYENNEEFTPDILIVENIKYNNDDLSFNFYLSNQIIMNGITIEFDNAFFTGIEEVYMNSENITDTNKCKIDNKFAGTTKHICLTEVNGDINIKVYEIPPS